MALGSRLSHNSYSTYGTMWRTFVKFCELHGHQPLPASQYTVCHYLAHLAEKGTVDLAKAQPYLSALNAVHLDSMLPEPAKGPLITRVKNGLALLQIDLVPQPREVPVSAMAIKKLYDLATAHPQSWSLLDLRALLSSIILYMTGSRPVSIVSLPVDNLCWDHGSVSVIRLYTKTTQLQTQQECVGRLPIHFTTFPALRHALSIYAARRKIEFPAAKFFFQLNNDGYLPAAEANGHLANIWWARAKQLGGISPPTGFRWPPRSLRSGAASASEAIGVPRSKTEWLGGWVSNSVALAKHYIDPSMSPTVDAQFFFDWLRTPIPITTPS